MILAGVGSSQKADVSEAVNEAWELAAKNLNGQQPSFVLAFASPTTYDQEKLVDLLKAKAPDAALAGASSSGEITSVTGSVDKSIALMLIYSDTMKFILGKGENVKASSKEAGKAMAQEIVKSAGGEEPKVLLMMPDGVAADGQQVVQGVLEALGNDFMLAGGSAGDDFQSKKTWQYFNDQLLSESVVGVGLYGEFSYGIGVRHGLTPISSAHKVTKAEGNVIYEIDGKPAFEMYQEYFAKEIEELQKAGKELISVTSMYPMGRHAPNKEGYLVRGVLFTDKNGALTLTSGIPEGEDVFLMIGSKEEQLTAAEDAVKQAMLRLGDRPVKAGILFNCISRKFSLLEKRQDEIDRIKKLLGENVPLIGFYTYGEQAPLGDQVLTCSFHNGTDVLILLAE